MVRWYYRSIFDELQDLRDYLESLNRVADRTSAGNFLPASTDPVRLLLPVQPTHIPFGLSECDDEVVVTAAMASETRKQEISLSLISPVELEITYECSRERTDEGAFFSHREQVTGAITQIVPLPKPVTEAESSAAFRNGVLEVHLKKARQEPKSRIPIE